MSDTTSLLKREFDKLNEEQKRAALHKDGPLLVLAGAGSGKTKVVAVRIGYLIETGVHPSNILGLTFTNKAAQEMKERVQKLVHKDVFVSTFHSLGAKILREAAHHLGFSTQFSIYDEEDVEKLLKTISKDAFGADYKLDIKQARKTISTLKNRLILPGATDISSDLMQLPEYGKLYALYTQKLKECNACDFDDLLFLPVTLFREFPDVLSAYQERWTYVLVDEYQDTNSAQYELIRLLVDKRHNLFVVGDPDQSIYSWRGANIQNILHFEKDYQGAKVIRLEQNYRSTKTILSAANSVIKNNGLRYDKSLWSAGMEGEKISVFQAHTERDEAEFVAKNIERMRRDQNIALNEVVIFYRTNFQSRVFEDELIGRKIPYTIIGGISFYLRKEIKDVLSYLRLLEQQNDIIAFMRVVNLPKRGFGEQFLNKILSAAQRYNKPIMQFFLEVAANDQFSDLNFSISQKQKEGWIDFAKTMTELQQIKKEKPLSELVRGAIFQTKYVDVIDADNETRQERRENLGELIAKAEEWEKTHTEATLTKFLEEISLVSSTDELDREEARVSLMTAHNGKGLEFELVFLVGLEEELFPHINSRKNEEDVEEERRLFYVGMTRAKKHLFATYASFRHLWGGVRQMRPSRFLKEIPEQLRQKVSAFHIKTQSFSKDDEPAQTFLQSKPSATAVLDSPKKYAAGQLVFHPQFGIGKVESVESSTLNIFFLKDDTSRKLSIEHAPLKTLDNKSS